MPTHIQRASQIPRQPQSLAFSSLFFDHIYRRLTNLVTHKMGMAATAAGDSDAYVISNSNRNDDSNIGSGNN